MQLKFGRTSMIFIQHLIKLSAIQVGFVNSLAFAKSAEFLVAGVGQVRFFSICCAL